MKNRTIAEQAMSDRGRIIFSAPFRRLQSKAQVFSLESDAAVRSRLTHSAEVAYLGQLIALKIIQQFEGKGLLDNVGLGEWQLRAAFTTFVETACLIHDIGNPPFGHFGEKAIQEFFIRHGLNTFRRSLEEAGALDDNANDYFNHHIAPDFFEFDGNAQGLRILTKLQWHRDEFGLNLTHTQIASTIKYPRGTDESPSAEPFCSKKGKVGFFSTERDVVDRVRTALNLAPRRRHPLVYIVEAADDIAYCVSDIEDALQKRICTEDEFRMRCDEILSSAEERPPISGTNFDQSLIRKVLSKAWEEPSNTDRAQRFARFQDFKIGLTQELIERAARSYVRHHEDILKGEAKELTKSDPASHTALETLVEFARKYIYVSPEAQRPELAGHRTILGLLEHLRPLLELKMETFGHVLDRTIPKDYDLERRLVNLLPRKHTTVYSNEVAQMPTDPKKEWLLRAHLITDYVSGMTDAFALETYRLFRGISV